MAGRLTRFLGDSPLRVLVRLIVISFVVGFVMHWFGIYPGDVFDWLIDSAARVYALGFGFFADGFDYLVLGAAIVVPIFLLMRVFKLGGRSGRPSSRD